MSFVLQVKKRPRPTQKPVQPTKKSSAQYITDDMLAAYVPSFFPTSQIELTISCRNLMHTHLMSKSDTFCIVSMKRPWQDKYLEVSRTEMIENTQNPQWVKKVILAYNFETIQNIKFEIRDKDMKHHEFLGRYETTLSELVASYGRQTIGKLVGKIEGATGRDFGEIIIVTEEVTACKQNAEIQFSAEDLPKMNWLRNNDTFLVISRSNEDGSYSIVLKTETVHATQNPTWQPFVIRATTLCNGDFERSIKIDCYNYRDNGSHKLIGTCYTNLSKMVQNDESMTLINEEKLKTKPNHDTAGVLKVEKISITEDITFLDYIRHGTQMHFAVAIDFTASNGEHTDPKSLHYLCDDHMNQYEIALRGVGEIIQHYDSSQLFPAFGFGAKLPPSDHVSFQFPLNDNAAHPYCSSVEEILRHYRNQLNQVTLYGPTNFAPVISNTINIAKEFQDGKHYFILLIITDGAISDMHLTKSAIIDASTLPISIIIVGVGDADFEAMNELDSDDVRLSVDDRFAERDIVQFVPLNNFLSKSGAGIKCQADLAEEVLAEIPEQLTSFMKSRGMKPEIEANLPEQAAAIQPTAPMD